MKALTPRFSTNAIQYATSIFSNDVNSVIGKRTWSQGRSFWVCQRCLHANQIPRTLGQKHNDKNKTTSGGILPSFPSSSNLPIARRNLHSSRSTLENQSRNAAEEPKELPSQQEGRRSHLSKRFSNLMDHAQSNIFIAGQRLNDLTGYSGIEALKKDIERQEHLVQTSKSSLQAAKDAYTLAITQRSASQREVNELLQRKHAWSPQDLERFTSLYRSDHANEQTETSAQEAVAMAERASEEATSKLGASILARYHEEQIWSDKIRRMSTWGTWGLMGVNVLLFLVFQIGVEPWRRRRLVKGFEEKVLEALEREGVAGGAAAAVEAAREAVVGGQAEGYHERVNLVAGPSSTMSETERTVGEVVAGEVDSGLQQELSTTEGSSKPQGVSGWKSTIQEYRETINDLFSERPVTARRVDVTAAVIEGFFAGAAIISIVAAVIRGR